MCREKQTPWRAAWAIHGLGYIACMEGDLSRARALLSESLGEFRERGEPLGIIRSLDRFGTLAVAEGEMRRAARLIAAAQGHRFTSGWLAGATEKEELSGIWAPSARRSGRLNSQPRGPKARRLRSSKRPIWRQVRKPDRLFGWLPSRTLR